MMYLYLPSNCSAPNNQTLLDNHSVLAILSIDLERKMKSLNIFFEANLFVNQNIFLKIINFRKLQNQFLANSKTQLIESWIQRHLLGSSKQEGLCKFSNAPNRHWLILIDLFVLSNTYSYPKSIS